MGIIVNIKLSTNFMNCVLPYTSCMLQIPSETLFSNASSTHDIHELAPAYAGEIVCDYNGDFVCAYALCKKSGRCEEAGCRVRR